MKIIFIGTTGVHHTLVAANIYLGRLKDNSFRYIKGFCDLYKDRSGYPIYIDRDEDDNQVYTLGVGSDVMMAKKSIEDLVELLGFTANDLIVKPVEVKGDNIIHLLSKIPPITGGKYLNTFISNRILQAQYHELEQDIAAFKTTLKTSGKC